MRRAADEIQMKDRNLHRKMEESDGVDEGRRKETNEESSQIMRQRNGDFLSMSAQKIHCFTVCLFLYSTWFMVLLVLLVVYWPQDTK